MPTELSERFTRKQWKDCCGKGCKKCEIAQAYIGEHGTKKGLMLLNEDRAAATKAKKAKKTGAKKDKAGGKSADKKAKAGGKKRKKG
jgi:hypothetical protein